MVKEFIKDCTREISLFEVRAWYEGHGKELRKWINFGFDNHLFISKKGVVTMYYDLEEGERFHNILKEKLKSEPDFFNNLCVNFLSLTEKVDRVTKENDIYNLFIKMMPALTIFDEIDNYPEIASKEIINQLIRIRKITESKSYELIKKVDCHLDPKDFIFFKDNIYPLDN